VPLPFSDKIVDFDLWILLAATAILLPFLLSGRKLVRIGGMAFVGAYLCFVAAQFAGIGGTMP